MPSYVYSTPTSFSMSSSFFHFWLAERSDVYPPAPTQRSTLATIRAYLRSCRCRPATRCRRVLDALPGGGAIKGEYRLVTLFTRTGQITTNEDVHFDIDGQHRRWDLQHEPSVLAGPAGREGGPMIVGAIDRAGVPVARESQRGTDCQSVLTRCARRRGHHAHRDPDRDHDPRRRAWSRWRACSRSGSCGSATPPGTRARRT